MNERSGVNWQGVADELLTAVSAQASHCAQLAGDLAELRAAWGNLEAVKARLHELEAIPVE